MPVYVLPLILSGSMYDKNRKQNCWPHYLEEFVKERSVNASMPGSDQEVLLSLLWALFYMLRVPTESHCQRTPIANSHLYYSETQEYGERLKQFRSEHKSSEQNIGFIDGFVV